MDNVSSRMKEKMGMEDGIYFKFGMNSLKLASCLQ
jgi:hypothetical protein